MYEPRTPGYARHDPQKRWALPDRVFFACGACHVLAYAFLERHGRDSGKVLWIRPAGGGGGNHIFVAGAGFVFDYHGYARPARYLAHYTRRARQRRPGWTASLVELPPEVLVSEPKSRAYEGLRLREPGQFLHDALPRARAYLAHFPEPTAWLAARSRGAIGLDPSSI